MLNLIDCSHIILSLMFTWNQFPIATLIHLSYSSHCFWFQRILKNMNMDVKEDCHIIDQFQETFPLTFQRKFFAWDRKYYQHISSLPEYKFQENVITTLLYGIIYLRASTLANTMPPFQVHNSINYYSEITRFWMDILCKLDIAILGMAHSRKLL